MKESAKIKKFRQEFGLTLRKYRHKLNLSQEAFADKAGLHRTYISSIELGKVEVGIGVAYKVAKALGLSLSRLMEKAENNT